MVERPILDARRQAEREVASEQMHVIDRQIADYEHVIRQLQRRKEGIDKNERDRDQETDDVRGRRFARQDWREALTEVRYQLTGERRDNKARQYPVYVVWAYIYDRYRKARDAARSRLLPDGGVEITTNEMQQHLAKHAKKGTRTDKPGYSLKQIKRFISELEQCGVLEVHKHSHRRRSYIPKWT